MIKTGGMKDIRAIGINVHGCKGWDHIYDNRFSFIISGRIQQTLVIQMFGVNTDRLIKPWKAIIVN